MKVAVIGAGWAGLAAAVEATAQSHRVTLYDMAPQCGGRARSVETNGLMLDNGQHIMIGAYTELLRLMCRVGADSQRLLLRTPLALLDGSGVGLRLRPGLPVFAFGRAVVEHPTWSWQTKVAMIRSAIGWGLRGFRCSASIDVATLTKRMPTLLREQLIDPLCIAALNTASGHASARVFLRVLRDALFAGPGSSDLLLPVARLSALFPDPALTWLRNQGVPIHLSNRVMVLGASQGKWRVDDLAFDRVVIAATSSEAARLVATIAPGWAQVARDLRYEPIVTVYLRSVGTTLPAPMLTLLSDADRPAQFVFDHGQLGGPEGLLAFVISGAQRWIDAGSEATLAATIGQAQNVLGHLLRAPLFPVQLLSEKRATFRCTPGLLRPPGRIAAELWAAGDYVDGPYPATLEGAVRSGIQAINADR